MGAVGNADGSVGEIEDVTDAWETPSVRGGLSAFSKRLWESRRRLVAGAISKVLWEGCGKVPQHFSKRSGSPSIGPSDAAASTGHRSFGKLSLGGSSDALQASVPLIEASQQQGAKVQRPDAVVDFLQADGLTPQHFAEEPPGERGAGDFTSILFSTITC